MNKTSVRRKLLITVAGIALLIGSEAARAQAPSPGITDSSISIGITSPVSGPAAALGAVARGIELRIADLNARGGVRMADGKTRKVEVTVLDDAADPQRALANARRLVESDKVFALVGTMTTASNQAISGYMNQQKVPNLFLYSAVSEWANEKAHPWSVSLTQTFANEAAVFVEHLKQRKPTAKIGVLYLNTDMGQGFLAGLRGAMAGSQLTLVGTQATSSTDPTVDTQLNSLRASGADTLLVAAAPRQGAQAVRGAAESGWKPLTLVSHAASSVANLRAAGLDNAKGVITAQFLKPFDLAKLSSDAGLKEYSDAHDKHRPRFDKTDALGLHGFMVGEALNVVLRTMKAPTRDAMLAAARNMDKVNLGLLIPGITLSSKSGTDGYLIESLQVFEFDGAAYQPVGSVVSFEGKTPLPQ